MAAGAERGSGAREFLTVRELAELLRVGERKVYDLAAAGEVPCSRVTGKLLFPDRAVRDWIAGASSGPGSGPRPATLLGSHDPLLEWALRQSRCGLATLLDGSLDGLSRFGSGEGIAAGLHLRDAVTAQWNVPAVAEACDGGGAVLVSWAVRRRGLVTRAEDGGAIRGPADLPGRRIVPRQPESGTQALFEQVAREAGLDPGGLALAEPARSEADAVLAVAQGAGDVAFGLEAVAGPYGLRFVPVVEERFDLLVCRRAWFEPPMQRLLEFCRSDAFRRRAAALPGYDVADLGAVRWNA